MANGDRDSVPPLVDERARALVDYVRRALRIELDFRPETLPVVDHYLSTARSDALARPDLCALLGEAAGAYFGSVAIEGLGGLWRLPSKNVHDWQICMKHAFLWINPIGVGYEALLSSDAHAGPRAVLHVAPEYNEPVEARLAKLPSLSDEEYFSLSTRLEVLEIAQAEQLERMQSDGYGEVLLDARDYEAELWAPRL